MINEEEKSDEIYSESSNQPSPILRFNSNRMSLRISTEASLKLLAETVPGSYDLFFFLGCLPDGTTRENLAKLWCEDLEPSLKPLESLSFLDEQNCAPLS